MQHAEGVVHGFLVLRTTEGRDIASGDLIQSSRGGRVTSRLVFHFKDGSLHDETVVFSQGGHFELVSDRLIQRGPSFPRPIDVSVDRAGGRVVVRYRDENGKEQVIDERMEMPPDVANGLMLTLIKNLGSADHETTVSMVATTPKPRLVKLAVTPSGEEEFSIAGSSRRATHYVVRVEIGGLPGVIAPLIGKQPPDTHVWILGGEAPAFVKSEGPLYFGGPIWRIELTSPVWSKPAPEPSPPR